MTYWDLRPGDMWVTAYNTSLLVVATRHVDDGVIATFMTLWSGGDGSDKGIFSVHYNVAWHKNKEDNEIVGSIFRDGVAIVSGKKRATQ